MNIRDEAYDGFPATLEKLGLQPPDAIALLPGNLESANDRSDLVYHGDAETFRKLWRAAGVPESPIELGGSKIPEYAQKDASLLLPAVFVSSMIASENPAALSIALGVIANYAHEMLGGARVKEDVALEVIVETKRSVKYRKITYEGPSEGLEKLPEIIKESVSCDD